jgi:parvulin-like peptidyl-prolyl isomerase
MVGAAALIVLILGSGIIYEYVIKPNAVLAEVNGHEIRRKDYWKYQSIVLYNQARQYESFAMQTSGPQQQQFLQFAATFEQQREDLWGSTEVSDATIRQMIDDRLYIDGAAEMGTTVTDEEADLFALNAFAPQDAPLVTPLPSPTLIPERAEAATQTAEVLATEQSIALGTPMASPQATPIAGTPGAGTPAATPLPETAASPASPAEATPDLATARDNAESQFALFQDDVFDQAHLSMEEFKELYVVPQVVRTRVNHELTSAVPQKADQVRAQHILVGTEELANQLYEQATGGADFGQLARTSSTDTATAATGGQLGWFTRQEVPAPLAEAAFTLEPGQISQPVQTGFGWHIIRVLERQEDRPLSAAQYQLATDKVIETWLEEQRSQASISTDAEIEPSPTPAQFAPPADAPTPAPPTPEATPAASPSAAPEATPIVSSTGNGTPASTAIGSPVIAPDATPMVPLIATPAG